MAKGQVRSNREAKKPKQEKKPSIPATPFNSTASRAAAQAEAKKK